MNAKRESLATAAGFFNGEGTFGAYRRRDRTKNPNHPRAGAPQADLWPLEQLRGAVGFGKIYGPKVYPGRLGKKPQWIYVASGFQYTQALAAMLWSWLSPAKREQAARALIAARENVSIARRFRQTCQRGHPLSGDNVRLYVQGARKYASRQCRICQRAAQRRSDAKRAPRLRRFSTLVKRTAIAMLSA